MHLAATFLCLCVGLYPTLVFSQDTAKQLDSSAKLPMKFISRIDRTTINLDKQLSRQTEKYLRRLQKKEALLKEKLYKLDSANASDFYANNSADHYGFLLQKFKKDTAEAIHSMGPEYLPYVDSLSTTLSFLNKNPQLLNSTNALPEDIKGSVAHLQLLQTKMQDADQIKQYIAQRKDQIRQYLAQFTKLPRGISTIYSDYNKELYYYSQQVREYRQILNDPDKMFKAALSLLNKLPAFTTFMRNNSFLGGLFSIPGNYGTPQGLVGLQSREQVLSIIRSQIGSGFSAESALQNSLASAQKDINKLKEKLNALGAGSGDMQMPDFKPQSQKTKTFIQRLEYGTNLQTQHAAYYFPTTSDIGLSVGYKLSDKSTIGIGASYKLGWGKDFQHINLSGQGAGLRSYIDIKAKQSFYLSGGFEYNYQPLVNAAGLQIPFNNWQQSGLVGISKIVSMNTRFFKKTKAQIFWDFLSYEQIPKAQPVKFRIGYSF